MVGYGIGGKEFKLFTKQDVNIPENVIDFLHKIHNFFSITKAIFGELSQDNQGEFKDIGKAIKTREVKNESVAIKRKRDGAMPFAGKRRRSYELGKWEDVTCDTCFGVAGQIRYITDPPSWCLRVIDPAMGKWGIKLPHYQMLRYTPERTSEWAYQKVRRMMTCCPVERKID